MEKFEDLFYDNALEFYDFETGSNSHAAWFERYMTSVLEKNERFTLLDIYKYFNTLLPGGCLIPNVGTFEAANTGWTPDVFEKTPVKVNVSTEPFDEPGSNYKNVFVFRFQFPEPVTWC